MKKNMGHMRCSSKIVQFHTIKPFNKRSKIHSSKYINIAKLFLRNFNPRPLPESRK